MNIVNAKNINSIDIITTMASTISISNELKDKIRTLGNAGDSYQDIIEKMYEISRKNILLNYLYDETDSISLEEFGKEIKEKWPKS